MEGVRFIKRESEGLPLDIFYGAPSCVPASCFETPFEEIKADGIAELLADGTCTHLGEMMNFPGVYLGDGRSMEKARSRGRNGNHGPRARRRRRAARGLSARRRHLRPRMQHNRRGTREAAPRHVPDDTSGRGGAEPEGPRAAARGIAESLRALPRGQRRHNSGLHPRARAHGRLRARADRVRRPPLAALRTATLTPAEYFRLYDRGAIAPGKIADLVLVDSLESCRVLRVWKRGRLVAERGKSSKASPPPPYQSCRG